MQTLLEAEVEAALTAWREWLRNSRHASAHTLDAYQRDVSAFMAWLAQTAEPVSLAQLAAVSLEAFSDYRAQRLAAGQAPLSVARALAALRNLYRFLDQSSLVHNPSVQRLASPKVSRSPVKLLVRDEACKAVATVAELSDAPWIAKRDEALFALLYSAGLRLGEALALTRSQAGKTLLSVGIGRRQRQVPVPAFVATAITAYLRACPYKRAGHQPLFIGARGKRLNPGVVQRQMRRLRVLLGLSAEVTPQAFRRALALRLRAEGGDLRAIQKLLGHAHATTTRRYIESDR